MLNDTTKRKINSLRQILVGKVPDPKSQVDQITNALIYKYMDDMDRQAETYGGKPSFFGGPYEKYSWKRLMDPKIGGQERMNMYVEALEKMGTNKNFSPIFRDILKGAFLPYRSPETLNMFLHEIDWFTYDHSEDLGDAFEYLLSIMGSQGDAGQFRTPRHIIDFMVKVVDPQKNETILDPACGTAGFLISSYKHILGNNRDKSGASFVHDERKTLHENFTGYDIDPGMAKLSRVNMFLHNFPDPKIFEYDTLSSEERWGDRFDIILANPPFMTPKGGIVPHNRFAIQAKRSEVLFVDYIMEHLKSKGRAGIIVPEGIVFQSGNAYKQLRKALIEDGLYAVVSLPAGVFQPYSGVKTSILFFDNQLVKKSDEVLFIKILNDGFDLGAQRRERPDLSNDLFDKDGAVDVLREQKAAIINGSKNRLIKKNSFFAWTVSKKTIAENGDYNLSGDRYRVAMDYTNAKWSMVELEEVCDLESGSRQKGGAVRSGVYSIGGEQISEDNAIRFKKMKYITETHFSEMRKGILSKGDVLMVKDGATTGKMGFWDYDYKAAVNEHVFIFRAKDKILPKYLYNVLLSDSFQYELKPYIKGIIGGISLEIKKIKIPLPPLEIQKQIVVELDGYQKIINGVQQIVKNWKPVIKIDPNWDKVKLGGVLDRANEQVDPRKKTGDIFYVGLENIESNSGRIVGDPMTKYEEIKSIKNTFQSDDLLYGKLRPNLNKVWLADRAGICSTDILVFRGKQNSITKFYWYLLLGEDFVGEVMAGIKGAQLPRVSFDHLKNLILPLPPLEIQKQIVEKIEAERAMVNSAKKLIEVYEKKIEDKINEVWGG